MLEVPPKAGPPQRFQVQPLIRRYRALLNVPLVVGTDVTLIVAGKVSPEVLIENTYGLLTVVLPLLSNHELSTVRQENPGRD
jgi:hypothetical protein